MNNQSSAGTAGSGTADPSPVKNEDLFYRKDEKVVLGPAIEGALRAEVAEYAEVKVSEIMRVRRQQFLMWAPLAAVAVTLLGGLGAFSYIQTIVNSAKEKTEAQMEHVKERIKLAQEAHEKSLTSEIDVLKNKRDMLIEEMNHQMTFYKEKIETARNAAEEASRSAKDVARDAHASGSQVLSLSRQLEAVLAEHPEVAKSIVETSNLPVGTIIYLPRDKRGQFVEEQWLHPSRYDPTEARWTLADGRNVENSLYHKETGHETVPGPPPQPAQLTQPAQLAEGGPRPGGAEVAGVAEGQKGAPGRLRLEWDCLIKINP